MIKSYDGRIVNGDKDGELHIHYRYDKNKKLPLIVLTSGFSVDGTESHRMFMNVATQYNNLGYATVMFDYKGCGYSDGDFSDFNFSSAVKDLNSVISWIENNLLFDSNKVVIHGQSLGTAIITVALCNNNKYNNYIFWNLSANLYERYKKILGNDILKEKEICLKSKGLYVKREFLEDIKKYDILSFLKNSNKAIFFLNSGSDNIGDPSLSEEAYKNNFNNLSKRIIIDGANHSFKCQRNLEKKAIQSTIEWLENVF